MNRRFGGIGSEQSVKGKVGGGVGESTMGVSKVHYIR